MDTSTATQPADRVAVWSQLRAQDIGLLVAHCDPMRVETSFATPWRCG